MDIFRVRRGDPDGRVASWNAGAQRAKGYSEAEIVGRHFSVFFSEVERVAGTVASVEARLNAENARKRDAEAAATAMHKHLEAARHYLVKAIEQNIDNSEFGIQELCEISRYSYQQVYRKVKALTGESINEFIRTVRLKRAAQYLAQSDTRISEIMYSVGFNSHSYFTKCFREHFGLSPKEYAEKHRRK